jgi:biotin transport system substrate-specific component
MRESKIRTLCYIAIFTALIAVCAQISIPISTVPLTMQTFAIMLAGVVLGKKNGTIAVLIYVLLGMAGVPVFAGFNGGIGIIFGRTGGFILSFPIMAFLAGAGAEQKYRLFAFLVSGVAINYFCGLLVFSQIMSMSLPVSFGYAVAPFIPNDILKIILIVIIGSLIKNALIKSKLL